MKVEVKDDAVYVTVFESEPVSQTLPLAVPVDLPPDVQSLYTSGKPLRRPEYRRRAEGPSAARDSQVPPSGT